MGRMTLHEFEQRYRLDPDPWSYETSDYERAKYERTNAACGSGPFSAAVELGCSIGVFTALLAPRCRRLVAIDGSATALSTARVRLRDQPQVEFVRGRIPEAIPEESLDLVIASEILYYLVQSELDQTLRVLEKHMVSGGRLVVVHWRSPGPERPLSAAAVHGRLRERPSLVHVSSEPDHSYLLDVWARR